MDYKLERDGQRIASECFVTLRRLPLRSIAFMNLVVLRHTTLRHAMRGISCANVEGLRCQCPT